MKKVRFLGLESMPRPSRSRSAEPDGEVPWWRIIHESRRVGSQLVKKSGRRSNSKPVTRRVDGIRCLLAVDALGVKCEVVAPPSYPVKAGDRVKTIGGTPRNWHAAIEQGIDFCLGAE